MTFVLLGGIPLLLIVVTGLACMARDVGVMPVVCTLVSAAVLVSCALAIGYGLDQMGVGR